MSLVWKLIILMKFWGPLGLHSSSFLVLGSLLKQHQYPFPEMWMCQFCHLEAGSGQNNILTGSALSFFSCRYRLWYNRFSNYSTLYLSFKMSIGAFMSWQIPPIVACCCNLFLVTKTFVRKRHISFTLLFRTIDTTVKLRWEGENGRAIRTVSAVQFPDNAISKILCPLRQSEYLYNCYTTVSIACAHALILITVGVACVLRLLDVLQYTGFF